MLETMKKNCYIFFKAITLILLLIMINQNTYAQSSFYDLHAKTIEGDDFDFNQLKGKKVLIVNTASKCGFTPQYEGLESLNKKSKDNNFEIIGFPSNDFLKQEPGTNDEIASFCQKNYGVTFQMMEKVEVKGNNIHPVYEWLTSKEKNGVKDSKVKWNFQKYLINETGTLEEIFEPKESPESEIIVNKLTK